MTDRLVQALDAQGQRQGDPRPFSAFLSHSNLLLLGDPGAGKTHLFEAYGGEAKMHAWATALSVISNSMPTTVADLHALVVSHLTDLQNDIRFATPMYSLISEKGHKTGKVKSAKRENTSRYENIDVHRVLIPRYWS